MVVVPRAVLAGRQPGDVHGELQEAARALRVAPRALDTGPVLAVVRGGCPSLGGSPGTHWASPSKAQPRRFMPSAVRPRAPAR